MSNDHLTKEQLEQMEYLMSTPSTVNVEVKMNGDLWIDDHLVCRNFNHLMGSEGMALKVEVSIIRAISNAEERAVENFRQQLAKAGIKIPKTIELFRRS
jgi:hypothetical protein